MAFLRSVRLIFALGGFGMLAYVAHAYHTNQHDAAFDTGIESRFVDQTGQIDRMGETGPTLIETAKTFVDGLLGREEEPQTGLAALRKRQAYSALSPQQRQMAAMEAEVSFWTGLFGKIGLTGP